MAETAHKNILELKEVYKDFDGLEVLLVSIWPFKRGNGMRLSAPTAPGRVRSLI